MMVWLLFIIGLMGLFFYNKIGSIISIGDLPTTEIIEPEKRGWDQHPNLLFCAFTIKETDIKKTTPKGKWFCVGSYLRPYFLLKRSTRPSA